MAHEYCIQADIEGRFLTTSELAILTGDPTGITIDSNILLGMASKASREIDSWLGKRYKIPLDTFYPIMGDTNIAMICIDLTIYNLYERFMKDADIPSATKWRRISALSTLKKSVAGSLKLQVLTT